VDGRQSPPRQTSRAARQPGSLPNYGSGRPRSRPPRYPGGTSENRRSTEGLSAASGTPGVGRSRGLLSTTSWSRGDVPVDMFRDHLRLVVTEPARGRGDDAAEDPGGRPRDEDAQHGELPEIRHTRSMPEQVSGQSLNQGGSPVRPSPLGRS
jgi:hypothetical protein